MGLFLQEGKTDNIHLRTDIVCNHQQTYYGTFPLNICDHLKYKILLTFIT